MVSVSTVLLDFVNDAYDLTQSALVGMPVGENVTVVIITIFAPPIRIKADLRIRCVHDTVRADQVGAIIDHAALRLSYIRLLRVRLSSQQTAGVF